jgi:hypothetical protein
MYEQDEATLRFLIISVAAPKFASRGVRSKGMHPSNKPDRVEPAPTRWLLPAQMIPNASPCECLMHTPAILQLFQP